jgi:hypothetical protein
LAQQEHREQSPTNRTGTTNRLSGGGSTVRGLTAGLTSEVVERDVLGLDPEVESIRMTAWFIIGGPHR